MKVGDLVRYKEQLWDCFRDKDLKDGITGIVTKSRYISNRTKGTTYICEVYWSGHGYCYTLSGGKKTKHIRPHFANDCLEKVKASQ